MADQNYTERNFVDWKKWEKNLEKRLKKAEAERDVRMEVGYTAPYALYVHEKVEMKWEGIPRSSGIFRYWSASGGRRGTAKFLERPARQLKPKAVRFVVRTIKQKGTGWRRALVLLAQHLERQSRYIVPVEYGDLKNSSYTMDRKTGRRYQL